MEAVLFQFGLSNVVFALERLGFFQLLFPFLLSLAVIYGILTWALGEQLGKTGVGLVSIVLSFFVMLYAATNPFIVGFLTNLSGITLIVAVGILMLAVLFGLVGIKIGDIQARSTWIWGAVILIVLYIAISIFFGSSGIFPMGFLISNDFWAVVFFIVVLVLAMYYLGRGGNGGGGNGEEGRKVKEPEKKE